MEVSTSNSFNHLLRKLKKSDEFCEKHNAHLVITPQGSEFCMECRKEEIDAESRKEADKNYIESLKRKSHGWLKDRSILSDKTLKKADFESFDTNSREESSNKEAAQRIGMQYVNDEIFNTLLTGNAGSGKSHLAMSILKMVNDNADPFKKCLFVSVDELFRKIKNSFDGQSEFTEHFAMEMLSEADVLVLDDIGSESGAINDNLASEFVSKILYGIMNNRMEKPTIITTNLNSKQLAKKYDSKLLSRMYRGIKSNNSIIVFKETKDKRLDLEF